MDLTDFFFSCMYGQTSQTAVVCISINCKDSLRTPEFCFRLYNSGIYRLKQGCITNLRSNECSTSEICFQTSVFSCGNHLKAGGKQGGRIAEKVPDDPNEPGHALPFVLTTWTSPHWSHSCNRCQEQGKTKYDCKLSIFWNKNEIEPLLSQLTVHQHFWYLADWGVSWLFNLWHNQTMTEKKKWTCHKTGHILVNESIHLLMNESTLIAATSSIVYMTVISVTLLL